MTNSDAASSRHMSAVLVNLTVGGSICCIMLLILQVLLVRWVFDASSNDFTNLWLVLVPIALAASALAASALAGSLRASIFAIAFSIFAFFAAGAVAVYDLLGKLGKNGTTSYTYVNGTRYEHPGPKVSIPALIIEWSWVLVALLCIAGSIAIFTTVRRVYSALGIVPTICGAQ